MYQIGLCYGDRKGKDLCPAAHADYLEAHFARLATATQEEFEEFVADLKAVGITEVYSANGALGAGIVLSERDELPDFGLTEYFHTGFSRLAALGGKYMVLGSGKARRYPEGDTYEAGMERFARCAKLASEIGGQYGVYTVIEPLNQKETNIVFTTLDGYRICELAGFPEYLGVLADLYHVAQEEPISNFEKLNGRLWHCHIAHPDTRLTPMPGDGADDTYREMFATLEKIGYKGLVSIEAGPVNGVEDYPISIAHLKELQA